MAHPRRIVAAETYLITRRCSQRTLRLRPSPETNQIFMYCVALATQKTGVLLHAICVMSDHHHLVVTDPRGVLPTFLRELHRLTAKAMNAAQGQRENLWASEPCNVVRLVTDGDVEDKIAYVAANPVSAGLVEQPEEWPGFRAWGEKVFRVSRPNTYFRDDGSCPSDLPIVIEVPPTRSRDAARGSEWKERIRRAIAGRVEAAHRAIRSSGRVFLGRSAVVAASFMGRAQSYEKRRDVIPTFAARMKAVRDQLRQTELTFRATYRAALERWRRRERDVTFPFGTWGMVMNHAVAVAPPLQA